VNKGLRKVLESVWTLWGTEQFFTCQDSNPGSNECYELEVIVVQLLSRHLPRRNEDKHLIFPTNCSEKRDSNPPSSAYNVGGVVYSTVTFALTKRVPLVSLKMVYLFDSLGLLYSARSVIRLS
jgi:hypothetical protein